MPDFLISTGILFGNRSVDTYQYLPDILAKLPNTNKENLFTLLPYQSLSCQPCLDVVTELLLLLNHFYIYAQQIVKNGSTQVNINNAGVTGFVKVLEELATIGQCSSDATTMRFR